MVFLMAVGILNFLCIPILWRVYHTFASAPTPENALTIGKSMLFMLPTMLLSIPYFIDAYQIYRFTNGEGVAYQSKPVYEWFFYAGALGNLVLYGTQANAIRRIGNASFFSIGSVVIALLCSAFVFGTALDQRLFMTPQTTAGVTSWGYFGQADNITDMQCDREMILVQQVSHDVIKYRCPTSFTLGGVSGTPFVPWPGYVEGESKQLAAALNKMYADAIKTRTDAINTDDLNK